MSENDQPAKKELTDAYEEFRSLLGVKTVEQQWQNLFAANPFILSRALPLQLDPREIVPMGTPGKSEADFMFYQRMGGDLTAYGAIELKRPDSNIITFPRKDLVVLTRDADTAIKQAEKYSRTIVLPTDTLFLGCPRHLFVIMGLSSELTSAVAKDITRAELGGLLPQGCQLLPFDTLLRRFEATLPKDIMVVVPALQSDEELLLSKSDGERRDALLRILANGDAVARMQKIAAALLRRNGPIPGVDLDDILSEAFVRLLRKMPPVNNLDGYFARTVHYIAMEHWRRQKRAHHQLIGTEPELWEFPQDHLVLRETLHQARSYAERTKHAKNQHTGGTASTPHRQRIRRRKTP